MPDTLDIPQFFATKRRRHYKRRLGPAPAPTLTAATYDPGTSVTLTFDRAINIDALDGSGIIVDDGQILGLLYQATGAAVLLEPNQLQLGLTSVGDPTGETLHLTASPANGITAATSNKPWPGVEDLALPFG